MYKSSSSFCWYTVTDFCVLFMIWQSNPGLAGLQSIDLILSILENGYERIAVVIKVWLSKPQWGRRLGNWLEIVV